MRIGPEGAEQIRRELIRTMSPEKKLELSMRLYWSARELKAAALRAEHPEWSEAQLEVAVRRAFLYART